MGFDGGVQAAALTDVGMRRTNNQDSHSLLLADTQELWETRGHFFMVADGMGAHAAGEFASKLAAEGTPHLYHKYTDVSPLEALERAIRESNTEIHRRGTASAEFHGMGTTATSLVLLPQGAIIGHVGDSRCYRIRRGAVEQLSFDHSLQWELRAAGQAPEGSDLAAAVPKNVITRSLGPNANVQVDVEGPHPIEPGDSFLLCSDGLTARVEDREIGILVGCLPPSEAAQILVDLANLRGGPDNITVVIARVVQPHVTTALAKAPPLSIGGVKQLKPVHPALWAAAGICVLAMIVMLLNGLLIPAAVAGAGATLALLVALAQRYSAYSSGTVLANGRRLGKGPYTGGPAQADAAYLESLKQTLSELQQAAKDGEWKFDRETLNNHLRRSEHAAQAGNWGEAVNHQARAISFMMREFRSQGRRGDSRVI